MTNINGVIAAKNRGTVSERKNFINQQIKEADSIFESKIGQTASKTISKTESDKDNVVTHYLDANNNTLFTKIKSKGGCAIYKMEDEQGNHIVYVDYDDDGKMDNMSIYDKNGNNIIGAEDHNDDGIFDTGWTQKNAADMTKLHD